MQVPTLVGTVFARTSALAEWFNARTENAHGSRKKMIVALARRLLIALWHFVRYGVRSGRPASCTLRGAPKVHLTVSGLSSMLAMGSPMTVRGGGVPCPSTASMAFNRMSRRFAASLPDAHDRIMVWVLGPRQIQGCGTIIRDATRELPLDFVHLTTPRAGRRARGWQGGPRSVGNISQRIAQRRTARFRSLRGSRSCGWITKPRTAAASRSRSPSLCHSSTPRPCSVGVGRG
jgi:hypothetical protein